MFDWIKLAPYIILTVAVILFSLWVKDLNDKNVICQAEKKAYAAQRQERETVYEKDKRAIVKFYDEKVIELEKFKRRENETDCQASRRFFNNRNYD